LNKIKKSPCTNSEQRQANDDKQAWKASWKEQDQSWRTEPEIDTEQQKYLAERREQGIYPFKGIKLSRADVEWLLATHENGRGPVDWNDESQREREGLDLRGANLHKENLSGLPLACLNGGLTGSIWNTSTLGLDERTAAFLEPVMRINKVIEEGIDLREAELKGTDLRGANLESANLTRAHLEGAALGEAQMEGAVLYDAWLKKASLRHTHLESAILRGAQLSGADLNYAQLDGADLNHADLKGADLSLASFEKAHLTGARLKSATLMWTQLDGASLYEAVLNDKQGIGPCLVDVQWGNTNITVVDWTSVKMLEDEHYARQTKEVDNYREAVRAYRQLSVVLGDQGLNEDAARFAYRAQVLQRKVQLMELAQWRWIKNVEVWIQNIKNWKPFLAFWQIIHMPGLWEKVTKFGQWIRRVGIQMQKIGAFLFSFFLDLLAGYGYRPGRTLFWYLLAIVSFASAYVFYGHIPPFPDALVFSLMSFHGRGFFPSLSGETNLHNPLVVLAALEAVIGLFIEISFIATFTKRFFGS
jgi:uncharacterized protein YjbI with pentapeptide repeats